MSNNEATLAQLNTIFRDVLDQPELQITEADTQKTLSGWDSVAHAQLVFEIEAVFNCRFSTAQLTSLRTVGDICQALESQE